MALDRSALLELMELLKAPDGGELMRKLLEDAAGLVVAEATAFIGAGPHERADTRTRRRHPAAPVAWQNRPTRSRCRRVAEPTPPSPNPGRWRRVPNPRR